MEGLASGAPIGCELSLAPISGLLSVVPALHLPPTLPLAAVFPWRFDLGSVLVLG